jgi:hypothetical protein
MPITITADTATGNITVAPTVANYHQGDPVQWQAVNGTSLSLSFTRDGTPFDVDNFSGAGTAERTILAAAAKGRYHYSLKTTILGTNFEIPGCPEIVVG